MDSYYWHFMHAKLITKKARLPAVVGQAYILNQNLDSGYFENLNKPLITEVWKNLVPWYSRPSSTEINRVIFLIFHNLKTKNSIEMEN